jgi:cardiolipin synthase
MTQLPNAISFGRLLSTPVVVLLLLYHRTIPAFWVFMAASISDAIDGYLARKFNIRSTLGVYLDPLADKTLLVAVFLVLGHLGEASTALVSFVVARDILIFISVLYLRKRIGDTLGSPVFISKVHTLFQMTFVTLVLGKQAFHVVIPQEFLDSLSYIIIGTTLLSAIEYIKIGRSLLKKS